MRYFLVFLLLSPGLLHSQENDYSGETRLVLFGGIMNYQGDLQPSSFSVSHAKMAIGLGISKPINRWISLRAGFTVGKIEAADRYNRDYLKPRNLSFFSTITELQAGIEIMILDMRKHRFSPYIFGGIAYFGFNPWTLDEDKNKVFLQPLGTEGQGLPEYPDKKVYSLSQFSLPYAVGFRYRVTDDLEVGIEFSQRKTFTDYLDDVSSSYADREVLLAGRGEKAVELAFRGEGLYPTAGSQRGTPTENDWYYTTGISISYKIRSLFGSADRRMGCPANVY